MLCTDVQYFLVHIFFYSKSIKFLRRLRVKYIKKNRSFYMFLLLSTAFLDSGIFILHPKLVPDAGKAKTGA